MKDGRRYDDDEIRKIFERATEAASDRSLSPGGAAAWEGMTLAELQEIGAQAGIDPVLVSRAADSLAATAPLSPVIRQFGVPVSVEHAVSLPAPLSDLEWDRLVVRLRDVFRARGKVSAEGSLRSWSNGNLQVLMEPTSTGHRLRLRSMSGEIRGRLGGGLGIMAIAMVPTLMALLGGVEFGNLVFAIGAVMAGGGVMFGSGVSSASRWVARRRSQFEEIGALARRMVEERPRRELTPGDRDPLEGI